MLWDLPTLDPRFLRSAEVCEVLRWDENLGGCAGMPLGEKNSLVGFFTGRHSSRK